MDQKITPFLWFDHEAEEAAKFYVDLFNNAPGSRKKSEIENVSRYNKAGAEASGRKKGSVMTVSFTLDGKGFAALNGGLLPRRSESESRLQTIVNPVSFVIDCKDQKEIDYFWEKLSEEGEAGICGWINRDRFGMTWQMVPSALQELLDNSDPEKAERAMGALMTMKKIVIAELEKTL